MPVKTAVQRRKECFARDNRKAFANPIYLREA